MGRPKQLLSFAGRTLLRRAVDAASQAGCAPVAVVLGADAPLVKAELSGLDVFIVENTDWRLGQGTSVARGAAAVAERADVIVLMTCDQPFVDGAHIRDLLAALVARGLPMAASQYADSFGVPAAFAKSCFRALRKLDAESGARALLRSDPKQVAVVPFPAGAIDLDTPDDFRRWAGMASIPFAEVSHADRV
jgi:molybdenum cofactor cytidylyltransferase